jgi:hypothetical protein
MFTVTSPSQLTHTHTSHTHTHTHTHLQIKIDCCANGRITISIMLYMCKQNISEPIYIGLHLHFPNNLDTSTWQYLSWKWPQTYGGNANLNHLPLICECCVAICMLDGDIRDATAHLPWAPAQRRQSVNWNANAIRVDTIASTLVMRGWQCTIVFRDDPVKSHDSPIGISFNVSTQSVQQRPDDVSHFAHTVPSSAFI